MTESLKATINSNGTAVNAILNINPIPAVGMTWMNAGGLGGVDAGTANGTSSYQWRAPYFSHGEGLIQTYTYRVAIGVPNYPAGTAVGLAVAPINTNSAGAWTPASITAVQSTTDSNGNAYFDVTFNSTPSGGIPSSYASPNPDLWGYVNGMPQDQLGNIIAGGDYYNPIVTFTVYVNGITSVLKFPVLYALSNIYATVFGNDNGFSGLLRPDSHLDLNLIGGGGSAGGPDGTSTRLLMGVNIFGIAQGIMLAAPGGIASTGTAAPIAPDPYGGIGTTPDIILLNDAFCTIKIQYISGFTGKAGYAAGQGPGLHGGGGVPWIQEGWGKGYGGGGGNARGGGSAGAIATGRLIYISKRGAGVPMPPLSFSCVNGGGYLGAGGSYSQATPGIALITGYDVN